MARRLALLADTSHEGAWIRASGCETHARVRGLGAGDSVWMTVITRSDAHRIPLVNGDHPFLGYNPKEWSRYRVSKLAGSSGLMTCVEVILGDRN